MSELEDPGTSNVQRERADRPERIPITARLLLRESLSARAAAGIIASVTVIITVTGGILARVLDHQDFPTVGKGLWFALQTVTTVGYGDAVPSHSSGRWIAAVVMLAGIGFLAVVTASVTASMVESSRRRYADEAEQDLTIGLADISERLARIELALGQQARGGNASD
jgi:voltage-gated potassium channel